MVSLTVSNYGLASSAANAGSEKGIYRIKNKGIEESKEIYEKIQTCVGEQIADAAPNIRNEIRAGLENRTFKKIKFTSASVKFIKGNGKCITIQQNPEFSTIKELFANRIRSLTLTLHKIDAVVDQVVKETGFKKALYLYSSGGGGHKSAKDAIRDKSLDKLQENIKKALVTEHGREKGEEMFKFYFPTSQTFLDYASAKGLLEEKDVLVDFVGTLGKKGADWWDEAQKSGNVELQEFLAGNQKLTSIFFAPFIFLHTLFTLIRYNPEKIVSTQPMCNDAVISAMAVYNALFRPEGKKDLKLNLYMTDMPTELSDHFFGTIRSMFPSQKKLLSLHAPKVNTDFNWEKRVGLKKGQYKELQNFELPIRPAFIQAVKKFQESLFDPTRLQIKVSCKEEREMLEKIMGTSVPGGGESPYLDYKLGENDEAHYIMLGSQPTRSAIFEYIDQYIEKAKEMGDKPLHLFLFAGKYEKDKNAKECLYKAISEYIKSTPGHKLPPNLKIVPLSFQDADQMVGLFARCHSVTRSGGSTCMELMVMEEVSSAIKASRKNPNYIRPMRYVHSQIVPGRDAEGSIPLWERGNFYFMRDYCGAKIVTPQTLRSTLPVFISPSKESAKSHATKKKEVTFKVDFFEKLSALINMNTVKKTHLHTPVSVSMMYHPPMISVAG